MEKDDELGVMSCLLRLPSTDLRKVIVSDGWTWVIGSPHNRLVIAGYVPTIDFRMIKPKLTRSGTRQQGHLSPPSSRACKTWASVWGRLYRLY